MRHNKTYTGTLEAIRREAWEENLLKIYEHNLLAAAGHHEYILRDNYIADLSTSSYMRDLVCRAFYSYNHILYTTPKTEIIKV